MPVEQGLELVTVVGADHRGAEGELLDNIINEVDGVLLRVPLVDLQRPDAGGVVDGGVLEAPHRLCRLVREDQELYIDLDMMARHLLLIPLPELHPVFSYMLRQRRFRPLRLRTLTCPRFEYP